MHSPLPLFPLNTVLVPGLVMPLHIFEPRYRQLIESLLDLPDEDDREFGIVAIREGRDPARDGLAALYPVGTATILRQADRLEDGRYDIVTTGSRRFRVHSLDPHTEPGQLVRAQVEFLDDLTDPADVAVAASVARRFVTYRAILSGQVVGFDDPDDLDDDFDDADLLADDVFDDLDDPDGMEDLEELPEDPTVLSYLVTAAMVLPLDERQRLLAASSTGSRLLLAHELLRREAVLISTLSALPAIERLGPDPSAN